MGDALENIIVFGVETAILFLHFLLKNPDYGERNVKTRWVEETRQKFSAPKRAAKPLSSICS